MGSPLPPLGEPLPPDVEKRLSDLVAQAAEKLSLRKQAEMQQQKAMEQMQDPIIQQRNRELDIQEGELIRKAEADKAKASINQQKIKSDVLKQVMKLQSDQKIEGAELGVRIGEALLEASIKDGDADSQDFVEGVKLAIEIQKELHNQKIGSKL